MAADGRAEFLDVIPMAGNTHEVAQRVATRRGWCTSTNDPIVLAHAWALISSSDAGATAFIKADLRDPMAILAEPTLA